MGRDEHDRDQRSERNRTVSEEQPTVSQGKIVVFGAKRIRRTWHEEQWFFSVTDVVAALTDSTDPK